MNPTKTSSSLIFTLWLSGLCAAAQFSKISILFPQLEEIYPNSNSNIGILLSFISIIGVIFGLVAGLYIQRVGFRKSLLLALGLGTIISIIQATLPPFSLMLATRVIEGLSHLIIVIAAPTLIAQFSLKKHRNYSMTLWSTFFGVSYALTAFIGIPLVEIYGPSSLFLAHGAIMLMTTIILWKILPQESIEQTKPKPFTLRNIIQEHIQIYRSPLKISPAIGWLFYALTFVALLTILPSFIDIKHRTFISSSMPLAGIVTSITLGVFLLQYFAAITIIILGFGLAMIMASLFWIFPANSWVCIALISSLGLVQCASFLAVTQLNTDQKSQTQANSAIAQMGNLGNMLGTPILLFIVSYLGLNALILFIILCYGLGIFFHLLLRKKD